MVPLCSESLASPTKLWVDLCLHGDHWGVCALLISSLFSEIEVGPSSFSEWSSKSNQSKRLHQGKEGALKFVLKTLSPCICKPMYVFGSGARRCVWGQSLKFDLGHVGLFFPVLLGLSRGLVTRPHSGSKKVGSQMVLDSRVVGPAAYQLGALRPTISSVQPGVGKLFLYTCSCTA